MPKEDSYESPPKVEGVNIEWVRKGAGWDCKLVFGAGDSRKRRHLRHLGKKEWARMREEHAHDLPQEIKRWVQTHRAGKNM